MGVMLLVLAVDLVVYAAAFEPLVYAPACIVVLAVVWHLRRRRRPQTDRLAGWSLGEGLEISSPDAPERARVVIPQSAINLGVLFIGSPGSGKTESCCIGLLDYFQREQPDNGWCYMDGKGQRDVYQKAVAVGAAPDFFFSSEYPHSHSINLMQGDAHDVTERLSTVLISPATTTTFYSDEQRAVLLKVVPVVCGLGEPASLRDLYAVLCVEDAAHELLILAKERGVPEADRQLAETWLTSDFKERVSNIAGLLNRLFPFVHGAYADRINAYAPDISLADVVANNRTLYCHLPYSQFSRDVAIMIIETFAALARKRQLEGPQDCHPFPLIFDDWGAMFHTGFKPFAARCRSANMPLSFAFQSVGQLRDVGPTYQDELDDNIATKVAMRVNGLETAHFVDRLLGTYETREVGTSDLGGRSGTSLQVTERPRVNGRDLRELAVGEAFVSTLHVNNGVATNPLYRARFPLPEMADWEQVALPTPKATTGGRGLGLWDRYIGDGASADPVPHHLPDIAQAVL